MDRPLRCARSGWASATATGWARRSASRSCMCGPPTTWRRSPSCRQARAERGEKRRGWGGEGRRGPGEWWKRGGNELAGEQRALTQGPGLGAAPPHARAAAHMHTRTAVRVAERGAGRLARAARHAAGASRARGGLQGRALQCDTRLPRPLCPQDPTFSPCTLPMLLYAHYPFNAAETYRYIFEKLVSLQLVRGGSEIRGK
jgi:hypothetical protein